MQQQLSITSQGALGRTELARLYFPMLSSKSAWQKLRRWFAVNPRLRGLTGLARRSFTPAELALIYSELGEP